MSHQLVRPQYFILTIVQLIATVLAYFLIEPLGLIAAVAVVLLTTALRTCASGFLLLNKAPDSFSMYRKMDLAKCGLILGVGAVPVLIAQFAFGWGSSISGHRLGDFTIAITFASISVGIGLAAGYLFKVDELRSVARLVQQKLNKSGAHG